MLSIDIHILEFYICLLPLPPPPPIGKILYKKHQNPPLKIIIHMDISKLYKASYECTLERAVFDVPEYFLLPLSIN